MSNMIGAKDFFAEGSSVADLRLLACPGAEELTSLIDHHLVDWAKEADPTLEKHTFIIPCDCPRFQSGDAKGIVKESVRGDDIFIVVDPGNYSVSYKLFGYENHMSPDDHFANLKRLIQAVAGKAHRVSVIMPSLYGGRQHRRTGRAWTAPWPCRSCRTWACRTSSPLTLTIPASRTLCPCSASTTPCPPTRFSRAC